MVAGVDFGDPVFAQEVRDGVARIEDLMATELGKADELMSDAVQHLFQAGGKRFRPLFTVLTARLGPDPDAWQVTVAGAVIELVHLATLYHDDVMDEAAVRHGQASANARWDNTVAILTGDFLFSCASNVLAGLGPEAIRVQATTFAQLVSGQIAETLGPQPGQDPLEHYMKVVTDKTASLIATSGRFGAMFSDAPEGVAAGIAKACGAFGVAWQLADDILDVASETVQSGKTPGTDLHEGVLTLPMLHALRMAGPGDARLVELLSSGKLTDPGLHAEALGLLRAHPAMELARADLREWAGVARQEIMALPDVPARAAFEGLCDFVVERTG